MAPATPQLLYHPTADNGTHRLHYSWTGWPSSPPFPQRPAHLIDAAKPLWTTDGLELIRYRWLPDKVQLLFDASPDLSPVTIASRAKGRIDHAMRSAGIAIPFSRKVSIRSVGDNSRRDVEGYIERQVPKEQFANPRFAEAIAELTVVNSNVDLSCPLESARGRYWYNLHVVLLVERRHRIASLPTLRAICDGCLRIAQKKRHLVSRLSVKPNHVHLALRSKIEESPQQVVFAYQNNLAFLLGQQLIWDERWYAGTFSEYTLDGIRAADDSLETLDES
jgi:REP element-mobilizing transposase RayT